MTTINELLDRWNSDEGKPYKGSLIDWRAYEEAPDNIGCMCAQGQVLHLLAGWTPDRLDIESQTVADAEVAKLLNISRTHAVLLRIVNDKVDGAPAVVLTDPGAVLGDQWSKVLDFWHHLDGFDGRQWDAARAAAGEAAWDAAWDAAGEAAGEAARAAAGEAAWAAAWAAAKAAAWGAARDAARASNEIQGASILRKNGTPLFFLRAFGFADVESIPARPASYGVTL